MPTQPSPPAVGRASVHAPGARVARRRPVSGTWLAAVVLLAAYAVTLAVVSVLSFNVIGTSGVLGLWFCSTWLLGPMAWACLLGSGER